MPYASPSQSRFIHAKANEGVGWAEKFVQDSHGTKVPTKPMYNPKLKRSKTRNYLQGPYQSGSPGLGNEAAVTGAGKRIRKRVQGKKVKPRIY